MTQTHTHVFLFNHHSQVGDGARYDYSDIPAKLAYTSSPQMESQLGADPQPTTVLPQRTHHVLLFIPLSIEHTLVD